MFACVRVGLFEIRGQVCSRLLLKIIYLFLIICLLLVADRVGLLHKPERFGRKGVPKCLLLFHLLHLKVFLLLTT